MTAPPLVTLRAVRWAPGDDLPGAHEVLRGIDLVLGAGERVGLVGPSGAGKTTLATIVAGLLEPTGGEVVLAAPAGHAAGAAPGAGAPVFRGDVGLLFAEPEQGFFEETVLEDVAFGPRNAGLDAEAARSAARDALARVGLDPDRFGGRTPETLSGGEARRAAIAGILAFGPRLVVLDEPTAGLDADGIARLAAALDAIAAAGTALLLVGHDLPFLVAHADRIVVLGEGVVAWDGPADRVAEGVPVAWRDDATAWGTGLAEIRDALCARGRLPSGVAATVEAMATALVPGGIRRPADGS